MNTFANPKGACRFAYAFLIAGLGAAATSQASIIYDSGFSAPLPDNAPSLGYQATSTDEFGDRVTFGGVDREVTSVTAYMSNWAIRSDYMDDAGGGSFTKKAGFDHVTMDETGYYHDLTFTFYDVGAGNSVGAELGTQTVNAFVPWRPEPYTANGILFTTDFDFSSLGLLLPDEVIYGLSYNTQTHGEVPIGDGGPYNSLNFAVNDVGTAPTVGVDSSPNIAYWDTSFGGFYTDGGAGGTDTFRADTNWDPYLAAVTINAVPEPSTVIPLAIIGLVGVFFGVRRRKHPVAVEAEE